MGQVTLWIRKSNARSKFTRRFSISATAMQRIPFLQLVTLQDSTLNEQTTKVSFGEKLITQCHPCHHQRNVDGDLLMVNLNCHRFLQLCLQFQRDAENLCSVVAHKAAVLIVALVGSGGASCALMPASAMPQKYHVKTGQSKVDISRSGMGGWSGLRVSCHSKQALPLAPNWSDRLQ